MYEAPTARLEEPSVERGSILVGFFLGWVALAGGAVLWLAWASMLVIAGARDPDRASALMPWGWMFIPLTPIALAMWFWRRGRVNSFTGVATALLASGAIFAGLVLWSMDGR